MQNIKIGVFAILDAGRLYITLPCTLEDITQAVNAGLEVNVDTNVLWPQYAKYP